MKRYFILLALILNTLNGYSQVGVNTVEPKATLDVAANTDDPSKADGIIAPRLTGTELKNKDSKYTFDQRGTILYVTEALAASDNTLKTANVIEIGYYYFDGTVWKSFEDDTVEAVVNRGNYAPKHITFTGSTESPTRDGALGMNSKTYSMYFGNMNPSQSGVYNISYGYGALQNLTTAPGNIAIGSYSLNGLTIGQYNTFVGHSSGYDNNNTGKVITGNVNVGVGNTTLAKLTSGYKNIAVGQSALNSVTTGSYNTTVGQSSGQFITTESKNVMLGAQTGAYVKGENNVFIGTGAGHSNTATSVETVNNRLVIHSNANLIPSADIGTENVVDLSASWTNGLIIGDFAERWVKFNGGFIINPVYMTSDSTYTKNVVAKPDGTLGFENRISVPGPPSDGTYILKSVNGSLQWSTQ